MQRSTSEGERSEGKALMTTKLPSWVGLETFSLFPIHRSLILFFLFFCVGNTVGDPMKDAFGPSLNILMKLLAIIFTTYALIVLCASVEQMLSRSSPWCSRSTSGR